MRAFIILLLAATASAKAPLYRNREPIPGKYLVRLKDGYDVDTVAAQVDGVVGFKWRRALNGFSAELSDKALEAVRSLPVVKYVEEDGVVRTQYSWGIDRIDSRSLPLDNAYTPSTGNGGFGYTAWVIDTGIRPTHVEFAGRAQQVVNFAPGPNEDCNGHGTHCSGIVGARNYGVAPDIQIRGVRVLNCLGSGSISALVSGIEYVINHADISSVASMSVGAGASESLDDAVNNLVLSGVPTAVSAGGDNWDACQYSPARAAQAVCVAATDINDKRASYSNYGPCVDIFAPGTSITSTWYTSDTDTRTMSGTSMSAPHVAGAIALYGKSTTDLINNATPDTITDVKIGSPNRFLYV